MSLKDLSGVAAAVAKVMEAELSPKQKAIAKLDEPKNKIDAGDLAKLRAGHKPVKEDAEQIDEISDNTAASYVRKRSISYVKKMKPDSNGNVQPSAVYDKMSDKHKEGINRAMNRLMKVEAEQIDEDVMTHITLGKKIKNNEGGYDQKVHHKGEHIGNIHSYAHIDYTGKKTGRIKYGTSDKHGDTMTAGHITPEEGIDELRWVHAQEKKDKRTQKEEVEQIDEYKSTGGVYKHKGTYGTEKSEKAGYTDYEKENEMAKKELKTKKGPRQNYIRSTRVNESFTDMLEAYKEHGLSVFVKEEPTEDQFNKEIKDQTDSFTGKKKQPGVATPVTVGTKSMKEDTHTEVEVYDFTDANGVKISTIDLDERTLSEPEKKKKEEIVKSMKKKMPGFKERYGERAKEVMYATATKLAKED